MLLYTSVGDHITAFFDSVVQQLIADVRLTNGCPNQMGKSTREYNQAFARFSFTCITACLIVVSALIVAACVIHAVVDKVATRLTKAMAFVVVGMTVPVIIVWCTTCAPAV